ncbi:MAG TPA: SDR family oxidoreductase, partial [Pyrinomonadaceae bacterium]|nr:SDR family oxidoreductase [Pyrinomonadaceae bacterium]
IENTANGYPVKRWANAEEIARAVMFLASDEATIIVATDFDATGGYTRKVISHGKHLSRNLQFFGARNL